MNALKLLSLRTSHTKMVKMMPDFKNPSIYKILLYTIEVIHLNYLYLTCYAFLLNNSIRTNQVSIEMYTSMWFLTLHLPNECWICVDRVHMADNLLKLWVQCNYVCYTALQSICNRRLVQIALFSPVICQRPAYSSLCYSAGGGIRTHEPLRDRVLSPAPLTRLGNSRGAPPLPADLSVARGRPR